MSKEKEQFEDIEIYPVEASAQGHNSYYLANCEHVGHRPAYCACLKKVAERKNGRLDTQYSECSAAIGKKECVAMKMRKEEIAEGRALYFINRKKLQSFQQYQTEMEQQRFSSMSFSKDKKPQAKRPSIEPAAPKKPQHFLDVQTGSYADAINAAIAAPAPEIKPVEQPKPVPAAPIKAGMSLLEMARLQMAAKAQI